MKKYIMFLLIIISPLFYSIQSFAVSSQNLPWIDSQAYSTLTAADVYAAAHEKSLYVTKNYIASGGTMTFTSNVVIEGGTLTCSGGKYYFSKIFNAKEIKVFPGCGVGDVKFGKGAVKEILLEWFGAVGDAVVSTGAGTDDSTAMQAAVDSIGGSTGVGGTIQALNKTYKGNFVTKSNVTIKGQGEEKTIFIPAINDAVIKTPLDVSTVRIAFEGFTITAPATQATFTAQDGIVLKTTTASTWVDTVTIDRVNISFCGRYGLHTYGESSSGPFVQRLRIYNSSFYDNTRSGLRMEGAAYETTLLNFWSNRNGGSAGTYPNAELIYNAVGGGSSPNRVTWIGGGANHHLAASIGNPGVALDILHATQINLIGLDFENANPMIRIDGSLTRSVNITGSNFGSAYAAASYITIRAGSAIVIEGNTFSSPVGPTRYIWQDAGTIASIVKIKITDSNLFGLNNSRPVTLASSQTISGGSINLYRDQMYIDTESAAASDNLDYIKDHVGATPNEKIPQGALVTISPANDARDVVVKHGTGNIYLNGHADFTMDSIYDSLTLQWRAGTGLDLWVEYSRSKY